MLGQRAVSEGSLNEVVAYPRLVVETALNYNAFGVILCHNHPGGNLNVSNADSAATNNIGGLLAGIGVKLIDHIICCEDKYESMAQRNMLFY